MSLTTPQSLRALAQEYLDSAARTEDETVRVRLLRMAADCATLALEIEAADEQVRRNPADSPAIALRLVSGAAPGKSRAR